jgi:hypothetical protein
MDAALGKPLSALTLPRSLEKIVLKFSVRAYSFNLRVVPFLRDFSGILSLDTGIKVIKLIFSGYYVCNWQAHEKLGKLVFPMLLVVSGWRRAHWNVNRNCCRFVHHAWSYGSFNTEFTPWTWGFLKRWLSLFHDPKFDRISILLYELSILYTPIYLCNILLLSVTTC